MRNGELCVRLVITQTLLMLYANNLDTLMLLIGMICLCKEKNYWLLAASEFKFDLFIRTDNSTQPIWMKDVDCDLSKTCVAFCQTCPSSLDDAISSCNHTQDMTVKCSKFFCLRMTLLLAKLNWVKYNYIHGTDNYTIC